MTKLDQGLKREFSGGTLALRNHEGRENRPRIQGKRQTRDSAGPPHQRRGRKRARSDTEEEEEKLNRSQPDCPPPKRRRIALTETQKRPHCQLPHGSGNLCSSSQRERNSPDNGRSSGGEGVHGSSGHRADSHPGSVGERQLGKSSLQQRPLPPVPVHPESAGPCQANEEQPCRKKNQSCEGGDESAPERKQQKTEASILVFQN